MYRHDGQDIFVIDGHAHLWDARPENWRGKHGESWIRCFYQFHAAMSPAENVWSFEQFCHYGVERMERDLFRDGYVDVAVLNSTYLREFYHNGFNTHVQNNIIKRKHPDRILLCGNFDPREEAVGIEGMRRMMEEYPISGLKLYTAEWRGDSKGWRLNDPWSYKYLEEAQKLGIRNVHVHKGPTVYPLSMDAFDVRDVDYVATDFPDLNFIVEHIGLPRLDDFCWIAGQESNVYAGLSVASAMLHLRPRYFGEIMANLLFWLGPDKICFGSDYAIWTPKWIIEKFMAFQIPEDLRQEYHCDLTMDIKRKILGENTARLYGIDIPARAEKLKQDSLGLPQP